MTTSVPTPPDSPGLRPSPLRTVAWCLLQLLVFLALASAMVPILPHMPESGLDPSWRMAMNHAVAEGMDVGRDVAFTLGPYVSVYTGVYHPATDGLAMAASIYLVLSFSFVLLLTGWRDRRLAGLALLAATLAVALHPHDNPLMAYPLLAGLFAFGASERRGGEGHPYSLLATAFVFAPLGLLALVKGSLATLCFGVGTLCVAHFLLQRMFRHAAVAALVPVVSLVLFWSAAGQDPTGLPHFFLSLREVTSGYSEAMSLPGPMIEVAAFAFASLWILASIALLGGSTKGARAFLLAVFSLGLFIAYKAGFVRHDGHVLISASAALMAAMLLAASTRSRLAVAGLLVVASCTLVIYRGYRVATPERIKLEALATMDRVQRGLSERAAGGDALRTRYQEAIARLAAGAGFPTLEGTVDIYSFNQALLVASGLQWNPRPAFQSYSAYTPTLARWNREHLSGPKAPDHLLFRVEAIDGRLPSMDDGSSWPTIIERYRPSSMVGDYLHLVRRADAAERSQPPLIPVGERVRARLGEQIPVPPETSPVFARIHVRPSALGRVVGLLHKTSHLRLTATLVDGSTRDLRVISGMLGEGVVVSPLVENTPEFALLLVNPAELGGKAVSSFAINPTAHPWQWHSDISVEFERLVIDTRAGENFESLPMDARVDVGTDVSAVAAPRCDGAIDVVNGTPSAAPAFTAGRVLHAVGWASAAAQQGHVPETILIALSDARGRTHFFSTHARPRPDVGAAYDRPELAAAGFEARIDLREIEGRLTARIALQEQGQIRFCPDTRIVERL